MDLDPGTLGLSSVTIHEIFPSDHDPVKLAQSTEKSFVLENHEAALLEEKNKMNSGAAGDWITKFGSANMSLKRVDQHWGSPTGPSAPALLDLANCVDISTLAQNPNKVLDGKYFLCRTIAPSYRSSSNIVAIVEDPNGQQGISLSLHNYSSLGNCTYEVLLDELPVAQILAIKNPWLKSQENGGFTLKCDNPEDIVVISESMAQELFPGLKWEGQIPEKWQQFIQSTPKTSTEWKNQGNKEFLRQKYGKAIQSYTEGLNSMDGVAETDTSVRITCDMLSNRAAAYIILQCFQTALEDVEKLLEIDPTHFKGLFRKGRALMGLQLFQEAVPYLEQSSKLASLDSDNKKMLMELLELAQNCLIQQKTGEYDILKLYKAGEVRHNDCADFVGPVELQNVSGSRSGRGLVATQHIQPGQLISASKAFQILFPAQELVKSPEVRVSLESEMKVRQQIVQKIVQKLTLEPNLCRTFYQLYAGPDFPIFDADKDPLVVDWKRIEAICHYNSFAADMGNFDEPPNWSYEPNKPTGIWTLPCFINHTCWDINATWTTYGDMLFVRALKEIPIGGEILISYIHPTLLYEDRNKFLKNNGLLCECRLCQIDRDDSKEGQKRMELLKKIEKNQRTVPQDIMELAKMVEELWNLEKRGQNPNLKLNPSLIEPLHHLGLFSYMKRNYDKTVDSLIKRYALATNSACQGMAVESCLQMIRIQLENKGNVEEAKKWTETLKKELMISDGSLDLAPVMDQGTLDLMAQHNIFLQ